jgi:hypothetical protein
VNSRRKKAGREKDRFEQEDEQFHQAVVDGFLEIAPQPQAQHRQPETSNGNGEKSKAFKAFMAEGNTVFAAEWDNARHWLIERYTKKTTPDNVRKSANDLTDTELTTLANTIKNHGSTFLADWAKQPKKEAA